MDAHRSPHRRFSLLAAACVAATGFAGTAAAQIATTSRITSPIIVATPEQMAQGPLAGTQLDGSLSTFFTGTDRYWLASEWRHSGGIVHSLLKGSLDAPYGQVMWHKETCARNTDNYCTNGPYKAFTQIGPSDVAELWFVGLYQPGANSGELLALVHEENVGHSGGGEGNREGRTRIGLAWSSDYGNNWNYLGRILSAYGDPQPHNIQGAPYLIKDGYMYVYYVDSWRGAKPECPASEPNTPGCIGLTVARADLASVIASARAGQLRADLWKKYDGTGFTQPGLGGLWERIAPWGISHTQAVHSGYNGKFYLPLTVMTWKTGPNERANSSVKLYESTDAVNWNASPAMIVADESAQSLKPDAGYQYCSIVDRDGAANAEAGQFFYLYCMKDPIYEASHFGLYRWEVNLGPTIDSFRQSDDFSAVQGPYWRYLRGDGTGLSNMSWQGSYWAGSDAWARIYRDSMHPGSPQMPALQWTAPKAGTVRIEGTVRDADPSCGDGVNVSVVHNTTEIFSTNIDNGDTVGRSIVQDLTVAAGDALFFIVAAKTDNFCDTTRWDPSIRYR
ncbi:MAG: hypothetical protein ACREP7_13905 [Lysobacter sp.]